MHRAARWVALVATLAVPAALPVLAGAAQFTVNSVADATDATPGNGVCATATGQCTLRAAIMESNALAGTDTIVLPAGTYPVALALPLASPMTLVGPSGARATVIEGPGSADVLNISSAVVTVRGVALTGGSRGISVSSPDVVLDQVAVRGNGTTSGVQLRGAGIRLNAGANVLLTRSLVAGNAIISTQQAGGGGVTVESGGVLTAVATTIAGNAANGSSSGAFGGGVMVSSGGQATLRHVTLVGNGVTSGISAANYGGNIYVAPQGPAGQLVIADSVVAAGQASSTQYANCFGTLTAQGRNIDSGTFCGFGADHLTNTNPQLLPLGNYGGPTDSMALATTSPARDQALACPAGGLDQRGAAAPAGTDCDIGALELSANLGVTVQASQPAAVPGENVTYVVHVANAGMDAAPGTVLDISAAGATPTLASASAGSCTLEVRCQIGTLTRGQEVTVTVVVRAGSVPIGFSARVSSGLPDPVSANDLAGLTTPVTAAPAPPTTVPPPALARLRLVGRARTARVVRVSTRLSTRATVAVTVDRLVPGRRARGACRATARTGTRCAVPRRVGIVRLRASRGAATLRIPARVRGRTLTPGRYRLRAVAIDDAGRRSPARLLTLRVTR